MCFIGDRSIDERYFGIVQKDQSRELERWLEEITSRRVKDKAKFVILVANNQYMPALVLQLQTPIERR